jgi:hypothetical protein
MSSTISTMESEMANTPTTHQSDVMNRETTHSRHPSVNSTSSDSPTSSTCTNEKGLTSTSTSSSSSTTTDLEAQKDHDDIDELQQQKRLGFIRYTALNVYRRLFSLAFIGNAIAFIVLMAKGTSPLDLVNASAVNLAVCGLCRQPLVVNALFLTFGAVPRSAPMRIRG